MSGVHLNQNDCAEPQPEAGEVGTAALRFLRADLPSIGFTQLVPNPPMLSLDDDTPLVCPLRQPGDDEDSTCEACQ
jgi:hypothetical protein